MAEYGDLQYDSNNSKIHDVGVLISVLVDEYINKYGVGMLESEVAKKLGEKWMNDNMKEGVKYGEQSIGNR